MIGKNMMHTIAIAKQNASIIKYCGWEQWYTTATVKESAVSQAGLVLSQQNKKESLQHIYLASLSKQKRAAHFSDASKFNKQGHFEHSLNEEKNKERQSKNGYLASFSEQAPASHSSDIKT